MKDLSYSYRDIIKIALPLMVSNFFYVLIALTDIIFMKEVGVTEQAAIGYVGLLYLIFFMIGFSYTKGAQILIAKKLGEGKPHSVGLIADNVIIVLLTVATLLFTILALFGYKLLALFISDVEVLNASYEYLSARKFGFFFSFIGSALIAYYSGVEKTLVLAVAIVTMSLSNITLNYALIFGKWGFPAFGISGAAYASNIAEALSLVIMLFGIFFIKTTFKNVTQENGLLDSFSSGAVTFRQKHHLFYFKGVKFSIINKITRLSSPLVVQSIVGLGAWFVFFTLIEKMGQDELAISNVVKQIYTVLGIPTFALASTTNTVIGNVAGRRKVDEVIPLLKRIILTSSIFIVIFSIPAFLFPRVLLSFIVEESLIEQSINPLYIALVALQIYGFSTVLFNCIASIGSTVVSMVVEIITIIVYLTFLYVTFFVMEADLEIVWMSEWVYWLVVALLSIIYLRYSGWRQKI